MGPTGISELVLIVKDVRASEAFYRDIVGLEVERSSDDWAWFIVSREPPQRLAVHAGTLLFEEHSRRAAGQRFGPVHFALSMPLVAFGDAIVRVRSSGTPVFGPVKLEWMKAESVYFYDPDDNLVEFWAR